MRRIVVEAKNGLCDVPYDYYVLRITGKKNNKVQLVLPDLSEILIENEYDSEQDAKLIFDKIREAMHADCDIMITERGIDILYQPDTEE